MNSRDYSDKIADQLMQKAKKVESKIKTKYKDHFDEKDLDSKIPKEYRDYLDTKK